MLKRWTVAAALGIYCFFGLMLVAQKPGLQYDEAFLVAGAVHMRHPGATFALAVEPHTWVCPFHRCVPLMGAGSSYAGAIKDYLALPLFAMFGVRTILIRLISMLLGALGIWGLAKLVAARIGEREAAATSLILALSPAYAAMTVFDNNGVAAMMAGLGLTAAALAGYLRRRSATAAFLVGLSAGFGVWSRANLLWTFAAVFAAAVLIYGRKIAPSWRHAALFAAGGTLGGLPFLIYQIASGAGTWRAQALFAAPQPLMARIAHRAFLLGEVLLSDSEHRQMWGGGGLPGWQLWLFSLVVVAACGSCLAWRRSEAKCVAVSAALLAGYFLVAPMDLAEHHLLAVLPLAAIAAAAACLRWPKAVAALLLVAYGGSALYWQFAAIRGLRSTGGVGVWSDAGLALARHLDEKFAGRDVKILDWGLQANLFVMTDGRLRLNEIFESGSQDVSRTHRSWRDEIQEGGVFLISGAENRQFAKPTQGFLSALGPAAVANREVFRQRGGAAYAEVLEIPVRSLKPRISMGEPGSEHQIAGFYGIEAGRWRWSSRRFSARLAVPDSREAELSVQLSIADVLIQRLGPITLTARAGGHDLPAEVYRRPGEFVFRRKVPVHWFGPDEAVVDFTLDKALPPSPPDRRELGVVVREIGLDPR